MKQILLTFILILVVCTGCTEQNMPASQNEPTTPRETIELTSDDIDYFYFHYRSGSMSDMDYEITKDEEIFTLNATGGHYDSQSIIIDKEILTDLQELIMIYHIPEWNGFDETASDERLTTANNKFRIEIIYDDQTVVSVEGDHSFPDGYEEAEAALLDFFDALYRSR